MADIPLHIIAILFGAVFTVGMAVALGFLLPELCTTVDPVEVA